MATINNKYLLVAAIGAVAGVVMGYVINVGLGLGGFEDILMWCGGGAAVAILRIKSSPSLKHLLQ